MTMSKTPWRTMKVQTQMKTKNIILAILALAVGAAANANEAVVPVSARASSAGA